MEWISVKDQLPEPGIPVLTFCLDFDYMQTGYLIDNVEPILWSHTREHEEVTHWMPLPDVPIKKIYVKLSNHVDNLVTKMEE